ncbi:hypothetical protein [Micromonospora aurantiaca (nom. illeg.)]|nr:hypothetical protein [Micromonospora aurantiaca]MBC9000443.1 hypothetical protein [Micromonospora aurantiaca]
MPRSFYATLAATFGAAAVLMAAIGPDRVKAFIAATPSVVLNVLHLI